MVKLKLKIGHIEIDFDGSEEFLKTDLLTVIKSLEPLLGKTSPDKNDKQPHDNPPSAKRDPGKLELGITSIAAKLGVNSGPSLTVAAACYLTLVSGKESFSRTELLAEMKKATGYYNANYNGNFTKILGSLLKDQSLMEGAGGNYALGANKKTAVEATLAS